jgi:hypothetical protein
LDGANFGNFAVVPGQMLFGGRGFLFGSWLGRIHSMRSDGAPVQFLPIQK